MYEDGSGGDDGSQGALLDFFTGSSVGRSIGPSEAAIEALAIAGRPGLAHYETLAGYDDDLETLGSGLSDREVLELVAGWERQAAAAAFHSRAWAAVLAQRPSLREQFPSVDDRPFDAVVDELTVRLAITRRPALKLVVEGRALTGLLSRVGDALSVGLLDAGKAGIFVELLAGQAPEVCFAVLDQVLPDAPTLTHPELRTRVQRAVVQVDPAGAGDRHGRAQRQRRVNRVQQLPDGMARFSAILAAPDAIALEQTCEAGARAARAQGDDRTLEQLRADVLAGLAWQTLTQGEALLPEPAVPPTQATWEELAGPNVLAADYVAEPDVTEPDVTEPDVTEPDVTKARNATESLTRRPAPPLRTVRFSGRSARVQIIATPTAQRGEVPAISPADLHAWDLWGGGPEIPPAYQPPRTSRPGIEVPELIGYGGIAPTVLHELLRTRGRPAPRRQEQTDTAGPTHTGGPNDTGPNDTGGPNDNAGCFTPTGRTGPLEILEPVNLHTTPPPGTSRYRPSAELDRYIRTRDTTCQAPSCPVTASRADVDHIISWPKGRTEAPNLHPLCRHHHSLKTHGHATITKRVEGGTTWTTALGQTVHRDRDGHLYRVPYITQAHGIPGALLDQDLHDHLHEPTDDELTRWNTFANDQDDREQRA